MNEVDNYILSVINARRGNLSHTFQKQFVADIIHKDILSVDWSGIYTRVQRTVHHPYILMESETSFTIYYVQTPQHMRNPITSDVNYII
jgi:hypothetical protein